MASDQLRGGTKGGSDEESSEAETAVAGKSGRLGATQKKTPDAAGDDPDTAKVSAPDTAKVSASSGVGDFLNHLRTSGGTKPSAGRYSGAVEENTLDIDGEELEEMRVETEQVAMSPPKLPSKIPRKETGDETTAVGSKSRAVTQDTSASITQVGDSPIDDDDQNVGDITAVTDLNASANLDATDILSKRLDESPEAATGDIVAAGKPARAKTVELRPEERPEARGGPGVAGSGQQEMDPAMKEAMASNPLASSRGTSLPNTATQIVVPGYHDDDEDLEESLAQMISLVRYRPPTKLAAIGSSIVLAAVAAFWVAGDGSTHAEASDEIASMAGNEAKSAVQPATEPADRPADEGGGVEEQPDDEVNAAANEDAIEAARKAASEKAEAERRAALEAAEEAADAESEEGLEDVTEESTEGATDDSEETDPEETDPEETDPEETGEEAAAVDETETEESMDFEVEPEEVAEIDTKVDPGPKPTGPAPDRTPKLSRKQQRAAAKALNKKATVAFMQGKLSASEKGFKAALKADPSLASSHRGLGLVYERRGSKKRAAAALRRYLKQSPRAKDAAAIRARLKRLGN